MAPASELEASDGTVAHGAIPSRTFASGRYAVVRVLPEGGQKIVYLVRDTVLDRECALSLIKGGQLQSEDLQRLRREAQAMARLGTHAHLVTIFDIGDEDGRPYIVSEFVAGGELRHEIRAAAGPLPLDRALSVTRDVARALAFAHARGIVHRDIKPANIWLMEDGAAKLGDFGLAFGADRSRLTQDGTFVGTAAYIAPEQALGSGADARSDLYALGCVLYEMVTGRVPFAGDDMVSVISQHIETAPVAPSWHNPQVPHALDTLIVQLLAKSPEDRPQSADALLVALDALTSTNLPQVAAAVPANPLDRLAAGVFVGRGREVEELRRGLDDALSGRGRLLLLVGEPGIGKTRTASELCTYARLRGAQVLIGRCYEGEGAPSYWPWVQAIRAYVAECDSDALRSEMGPGAADIAQMVSEVHAKLPGLTAPPAIEPDQARFRLFDSITTFLKNASRRQPLVLLLDDLHWADTASLLMLQFLVRDLTGARLVVLGTYRDVELGRQHPLAQTLAELAREQVGTRVLLRGLGEPEVARYIAMTAGSTPSDALVAAVFRETEGNPFFLSEVVRLLVADGRLQDTGDTSTWTVAIPQSVREVVGRRLNHLGEECNSILTMAAVIGREFGLDALERLTEIDGDHLLELIEEAEAARVIEEVQGKRTLIGRYAFSHALIRETLYDEVSATRRVRMHRQIGETLEALYGTNADRHLAELAQHFYAAAPGGDVAKAVDYLRRAGSASYNACAYEDAIEHFKRALDALDLDSDDKALRFECTRSLALTQSVTDVGAAIATSLHAISIARLTGDPHTLARAALAQHEIHDRANQVIGDDADRKQFTLRLLEEALDLVTLDNDEVPVRLLSAIATSGAISSGDSDEALARLQSASQEAVQRARSIGEPQLLADALMSRHNVLATSGPSALAERVKVSTELATIPVPGVPGFGLSPQIVDCIALGEMDRARELTRQWELIVESDRFPPRLRYASQLRALHALFEGQFDEAERLAIELLTVGTPLETARVTARASMVLAAARRERGRLAELEPGLRGFAAQYPSIPAWFCSLAWLYVETDRPDDARSVLGQFDDSGIRSLPCDENWMLAIGLLSEVAAALADRARASTLYELALPFRDQNAVATVNVLCLGACSRVLGLLAATMRRWDEAEEHFEHALAFNTRMRTPPWIAYTQYNYATMLVARNAPGDRERALGMLDEAIATAEALGMKALLDKATALRAAELDAGGAAAT